MPSGRRLEGRLPLVICLQIVLASAATSGLSAQSTWSDTEVYQWYQRSSERPMAPPHNDRWLCEPSGEEIDGSCGVSGLSAHATAVASIGGPLRASTALEMDGVLLDFTSLAPDADQTGVEVYSNAGFSDRITFGGVTPAALRFNYLIDGFLANAALGDTEYLHSGMNVWLYASQEGGTTQNNALFSTDLAGESSGTEPVSAAGFFDLVLHGAGAVGIAPSLSTWSIVNDFTGNPITGRSSADFSHTALFGIQALDDEGRDITAAADLRFASGVLYPALPSTTTPEPLSLVLLATGLAGVGAVRRRRRQRSRT